MIKTERIQDESHQSRPHVRVILIKRVKDEKRTRIELRGHSLDDKQQRDSVGHVSNVVNVEEINLTAYMPKGPPMRS